MNRRIAALLLLAIFLFGCATEGTATESAIIEAQERDTLVGNMVANWELFAVMLMLISVGLVAMAYAISISFNLPDLRAWADVELSEVFTTALIVIFIIAILVFVDVTAGAMVASEPMFAGTCDPMLNPEAGHAFCPSLLAKEYIGQYVDAAETLYEKLTKRAINKAQDATYSSGLGISYQIYLYLSISWRNQPWEMMNVERLEQLINFTGMVLGALHTQRFLIDSMSLGFGPIALLLGIVFRSFFVTRKMGGLLMAFGIGFMLVYPASYALGWFTLNVAIYGVENVASGPTGTCPQSCLQAPPSGFYTDTLEPAAYNDVYAAALEEADGDAEAANDVLRGFFNGSTQRLGGIESCEYYGNEDALNCSSACRSLPYPMQSSGCAAREAACAEMPDACIISHYYDSADPVLQNIDAAAEVKACPADCQPLVPMKRDCIEEYGYSCPSQCRYVILDTGTGATKTEPGCWCTEYYPTNALELWSGARAEESCVYIIPEKVYDQPTYCNDCSYTLDPGLAYKPQVFVDCTSLCGSSTNPTINTEDPATASNKVDGFIGNSDIKSAAKLVVPAFLLPLFNLAVTFIFIQTLSPMLGGDIDIPGMMRLI